MSRLSKTAWAVGIGAAVLTVDYILAAYELYAEKHGPRMNAICEPWCVCKCNTSGCGCHERPKPR